MADDDWQDWQPPAATASQAAQDDGWQDWQPPAVQTAAADDGWQDWQDTRDSRPPTPEDWANIKPDQINKVPESRGIQERATAGFKEGYHPIFGDAVKQIAPDFTKEHPIISGVLQGALNQSPLGWADKAQAALFGGAPGGVAGAVAGAAEPLIGRPQADKLQSDVKTLIDMGLVAPGLGWAGAAAHGRMGQLGDVGKQGLKDLKKQGQTPGPAAAPGVAQDPNPPARSAVADFQNKTTLGDGQLEKGGENLNTRDYGKTPEATSGEATGVNVLKDGVDPTLSATLKGDTTAAERPATVAREQPPMGTQVPTVEQAAEAQARIAARKQPPAEPTAGLLPEKQPFYDAAKAAAPNLPEAQLTHIANLAGGPKGAALMARNAARRMAEDVGAPAARVVEAERAPVPAGTMELPPVEVKPPGVEVPTKAAEAIATSKAAEVLPRPEQPKTGFSKAALRARRAQREGKQPSGLTVEDYAAMDAELGVKPGEAQPLRPGSPEAQAAIEKFNAKPTLEEAAQATAQAAATPKEAIAQRAPGETVSTALTKRQFEHKVKEAERLRLTHGIQPKDPAVAEALAKRDAVKAAKEEARRKTEAERAGARRVEEIKANRVDANRAETKAAEEAAASKTRIEAAAIPKKPPLSDAEFKALREKVGIQPELPASLKDALPPLYPHAALSRPKLEAAYKKAKEVDSKTTRELIDAGRGNERPSETAKKTDELSQRAIAAAEQRQSLYQEMERRKAWGGTTKPIPEAQRDSFYAPKKGQQFAPQELPSGQAPPKITPESRPIEPTGRPVPEGARAEVNQRLDQTTTAADPVTHLRETAARARELGLEGQARQIESAAAEMERQQAVQYPPGPGERSTGTLRQQQEGVLDRLRSFMADESGAVQIPASITRAAENIRKGYDSVLDFGREAVADVQMKFTPMAADSASARARVVAKDQANAIRRIDQQWSVADDHINKHFDETSRKRMWEAADEENVMRQTGEVDPNKGLGRLNPRERTLVESFQPQARELWQIALDIGWAHGDPLPYYTPRMFEGIVQQVEGAFALDAKGRNISTTTPGMKRRKHLTTAESEAAAQEHFGAEAKVVRDIRTMPMALAKMEKALVNRIMIKKIEEMGRRAGENTVIEGNRPNEPGWFTLPDNPAFYTFRPRYEIADTPTYRAAAEARSGVAVPEARIPLLDRNGNPVIDRVPIWMPGEFRGPLKAIMSEPSGRIYTGFMEMKGKTMGLIMNSPMIHNMVEWGRAFPTMPGKMATLQVYFEGNAAKKGVPYNGTTRYVRDWASGRLEEAPRNASPEMIEAIDHGLVPIGKRFFNQDITAIMENPDLTPGRSLTAKTLALVPDLFSPKAGDAVKRAVDRAGDVWHNTLLWDRIADLQMGLYVNAKKDLIAKGTDPKTAQYVAAHIANRYAGALPNEAMSAGARKAANFLMFSRTFTLGNLGVLKDMFTGLPRDVQAQIMRDMGTVDPSATGYAQSLARRKAMMAVGLDIGLMYIGNSVLQSVFNVINSDENITTALGTEGAGYARRFKDATERLKEDNPMALLNPITAPVMYAAHAVKSLSEGKKPSLPSSPISAPSKLLGTIESLSATYENEPGKYGRIKVGETKEGRGVYMRLPVGKLGEEYIGYLTEPLEIAKRKLGTIAGPALKMLANDKGFGEKIYESKTDLLAGKQLETATEIAKMFFLAQTPEGQLKAGKDLLTGQGNRGVNILQAAGPIGGFTFSQGHPGGPAAGELAAFREHRQFELKPHLTEIRKLVQDGKQDEAIQKMNELDLDKNLRRQLLNPRMSVRGIRELFRHGEDEQVERFERKR